MDPFTLQKQVRDNAEDLQSYMLDLKNWQSEMKRKEAALKGSLSECDDTVPMRSKVSKTSKKWEETAETKNDKEKRIPSYDYSSWEKFDVDKACKEIDQEENSKDKQIKFDSKGTLRDEANYEKEVGNNFVKKQKWEEAVHCYTRAIKLFSFDPIFFANRALCNLKLNNFELAVEDSTKAIELDPSYVKAYQRRAAARVCLKQLEEAKSDFLKVLDLEPKNSVSKAELSKLEKILESKRQRLVTRETIVKDVDEEVVTASKENTMQTTAPRQGSQENVVQAIYKPPHLRSKKPLKRIEIREVIDDETELPWVVSENHSETFVNIKDEGKRAENSLVVDNDTEEERTQLDSNSFLVDKHTDQGKTQLDSDAEIPPVPASSVRFLVTWNSMKNNSNLRYRYLQQIPGNSLPDIFHDSLESHVLSEIISVLVNEFISRKAAVYPYLQGLTQVRRFGVLVLFLTQNDKQAIEKLINYCEVSGESTAEEATNLRTKFGL